MLRSLFALTLSFAFVPVAMAIEPPVDTPIQLAMFNGPATGSCLQTPSNLPSTQDRAHQAQCQTVGAEQMYVFETAALGYRIRTAQGANCFEAETGSTAGDPARLFACTAEPNQQWQVNYSPGNPTTAVIRNVQTGLCLDVANGFSLLSACGSGLSFGPTWLVNAQAARLPGTAMALRSVLSDACMSLDGLPVGTPCTNDGRTSLRILPVDTATASVFRFQGTAEGTCLLEVDGVPTFDLCITGPSAHWQLVEHSMGNAPSGEKASNWLVQSVNNGQCLNVRRGGVEPEEALALFPCDSLVNAQWQFTRY